MSGEVRDKAWLPDGHGLPHAGEPWADRGLAIHLRLTSPDGSAAKGACNGGLGQWWTGVPAEVNCPECLAMVHA